MEYRSVANRCAVVVADLHVPISDAEALSILMSKGFRVVNVDIVVCARQCIGRSRYHLGAQSSQAPAVVDCSSFVKWLYAQRGIWLPRRAIQQRNYGDVVEVDDVIAGDLVFVSSWTNYYDEDPADGVGHVGIATGEGTVIHAAYRQGYVIESPLEQFVSPTTFRGARRYVPEWVEVLTLEIPPDREIEITDDLRWIVLQSLPRRREPALPNSG